MSNYTKSTNFATKDNLTPGDPLKVVRGTEIDTEFNNISTAIATKTDNSAAAITGGAIDGATVGATTPATGAFTTLAASGTTTLAGALVGAATQSAFNTVSTTLNLGGAATALNLGAATGTATVNNTTLAAKAITASTTLAVTGTSTLTGAVTATAGVSGPITSSSVSITGGSITGITDLAVADGGTGASTAADGLNNLLPSQTGNASKYLQTDGTNASWDAVSLSTADITGTLGAANGGTGVSNNAAMTVTGSGNFAYTRTLTGTTNVTFPTTGTLATLAGTETLTNKTINLTSNTLVATSAQILAAVTDETGTGALVFATSPTLVTPTLGVATGTSFQGIIGNVTPAAGSFTTLGASSTATLNTLASSGATLTGGTINGMTVGATTASSGAFTTVTASTAIGTASGGTGLGGATPFTSGGVVYASSSSALATGSALTYDGAGVLTVGSDAVATVFNAPGDVLQFKVDSNGNSGGSPNIQWLQASSELMRLTSTGLGIGTSSPAEKLDVRSSSNAIGNFQSSNASGYAGINAINGSRSWYAGIRADASNGFGIRDETAGATRLLIDSSGNLGLGVIPSDWASTLYKVLQVSDRGSHFASNTNSYSSAPYLFIGNNAFSDVASGAGFKYVTTNASAQYRLVNAEHQFFTAASGTAGNPITFTQAMTLDASGNLGVGTTSTSRRLSVTNTASDPFISIVGAASNEGGLLFGDNASDAAGQIRYLHASDAMYFATNLTERARINTDGNLLVGTTSGNARVRVVATSSQSGGIYVTHVNSGNDVISCENSATTGNNVFIAFYTDATVQRGSISYNRAGGLVAYNTTSDYRAKDINGPVTGSGALIDSTPVYMGKMKGATQERPMFIAHETPAYAHTGEKDAVDADGNPVYQQMDASALIPVMWAEIQSLRQRLSAANL